MPDLRVAWWNLENLFDRESAPRHPDLAATLAGELQGWTAAVRNRKLDQLASIIRLMFAGAGPDLLGVCEVENEDVLQLLANRLNLPGRSYQVLAHNSPDARGIDVSFLFDQNVLAASNPGHQVVVKRTATRDLFWATFTVSATAEEFVAIGNHWPARSAGQYKSEPFRMLTGETVSVVLQDLLDGDPNLPILLMGDFNDEPFNRSTQEYLLGNRDREQVMRAHTPRVWNLMWPLMSGNRPGTYRFGSNWNMLDQLLASKGLVRTNSPIRVLPQSTEIFRPSVMQGSSGRPRRYGRPSATLDQDGFSDHFPITVLLRAS